MLLHKQHLNDMLITLETTEKTIRNKKTFNANEVTQRHNKELLELTFKKIESYNEYMNKISTHLIEEGNQLTELGKKIKIKETEEKIRVSSFLEDSTEVIRTIHELRNEFQKLKVELEGIVKNNEENNFEETIRLIEIIKNKIKYIMELSEQMVKILQDRKKELKEEIKILNVETDLTKHIEHNINSWFLH